jgi:hypothetical protein
MVSDTRGRLRQIWSAWELQPSEALGDKQIEALDAAEAWLQRGTHDPEIVVRAVQVLLAEPERPGWKDRPCWQALCTALAEVWTNAGTGNDHMIYGQALLLAAWPESAPEGWMSAALLLDAAWSTMRGRRAARTHIESWRRHMLSATSAKRQLAEGNERVGAQLTEPFAGVAFASSTDITSQLQQNVAQQTWNRVGPQLQQILSDHRTNIELLGAALTTLSKESRHNAEALNTIHSGAELDLLWWGQSRYCRPIRKPYRCMAPDDVLWWASHEAAHLSCSLEVEPAAAYLIETLHALGQEITKEKKPLHAWMNDLHATLRRASGTVPVISARLAQIANGDALGLPVTWVRLQAARNADLAGAAEAIWLNLDAEIDRGDWASWIFRESLLDVRLGRDA